MSKKYIHVKEVETDAGPRFRVVMEGADGGDPVILRDGMGAGIFQTPKGANLLGDFWAERKKIPFEHYPDPEVDDD